MEERQEAIPTLTLTFSNPYTSFTTFTSSPTTSTSGTQSNSAAPSSTTGTNSTGSSLSTSAKAGIGVGVSLGVILLGLLLGGLFWRRRRREKALGNSEMQKPNSDITQGGSSGTSEARGTGIGNESTTHFDTKAELQGTIATGEVIGQGNGDVRRKSELPVPCFAGGDVDVDGDNEGVAGERKEEGDEEAAVEKANGKNKEKNAGMDKGTGVVHELADTSPTTTISPTSNISPTATISPRSTISPETIPSHAVSPQTPQGRDQ